MFSFQFKKGERLKSRKAIEKLFQEGQSLGQYPLRLVWVVMENRSSEFPVQFTPSVSKKKFPKAIHRNRLKRLVREAYRLNKHRLYKKLEEEKDQIALMVIYTAKEELSYQAIEKAMQTAIHRFLKKWRSYKRAANQEEN